MKRDRLHINWSDLGDPGSTVRKHPLCGTSEGSSGFRPRDPFFSANPRGISREVAAASALAIYDANIMPLHETVLGK